MKILTVKLPDELAARLEKRARRFGLSQSAVVRASLEQELKGGDDAEEVPSAYDLMKSGVGCIETGLTDLATNPRHMRGFGT